MRYSVCLAAFALGMFASVSVQAAEPVCRPKLSIGRAQLDPLDMKTLKRTWRALVIADASGCAPGSSGVFDLAYTRLQEIGPDADFRERHAWRAGKSQIDKVVIEMQFGYGEAVHRAWIENVSACPCAAQ